jgi:hypothetical protein
LSEIKNIATRWAAEHLKPISIYKHSTPRGLLDGTARP